MEPLPSLGDAVLRLGHAGNRTQSCSPYNVFTTVVPGGADKIDLMLLWMGREGRVACPRGGRRFHFGADKERPATARARRVCRSLGGGIGRGRGAYEPGAGYDFLQEPMNCLFAGPRRYISSACRRQSSRFSRLFCALAPGTALPAQARM